MADAITNHHVKTKEGYKMKAKVIERCAENALIILIRCMRFSEQVVSDIKELFARVESIEGRIDFNATYRRGLTERIEKLEQANYWDRMNWKDLICRIEKLEQEPKYTHRALALQSSLLSLSDRIEKLQASIAITDEWLPVSTLKQINERKQIESLHAQLTVLTTELRNCLMQNQDLENQVTSLKTIADNSPFVQGAD